MEELETMMERVRSLIGDELYTPMDMRGITAVLALEREDYDLFAAAVDELKRSGEIVETQKGKLITADAAGLIAGVFRSTTRGFGFVAHPDGKSDDIFISHDNAHGAMNGDRVQIKTFNTPKGREGEVMRVLERALCEVVGTVKVVKAPPASAKTGKGTKKVKKPAPTRFFVYPDDPKLTFRIEVLPAQANGAREGDKVLCRLTRYPHEGSDSDARGRVLRVFGETTSLAANYMGILHESGIKTKFDDETLAEARAILPGCSVEGRLDLRDRTIFTIDGPDAKDFDDAISVERDGDGYILGVHIADVTHYVTPGSALDAEAMRRGTSVYFTDKVVPMLPEELSNGVCSLNRDSDKYALSVFIKIDADGSLLESELRETVISSKLRGVYPEVNDVLAHGEASEFFEKYSILYPDTLPVMVELYEKLAKKAKLRGSLELETAESAIILGKDGMPIDVVARERGISERMIEQFMLAANESVAAWLTAMALPCVFRTHGEPSPDKVQTFTQYAHNLGLDIRPLRRRKLLPSCYREVYDEAMERGLGAVVTPMLLRSLMKARYSDTPSPHFGLGCELYCHFTSPIRRYPDLAVHRIVKAALHGEIDENSLAGFESFVHTAAEESTENEQRAVSAERAIEDLYKTIFMADKVGEKFEGIVDSVASFGMFVQLPNTCEGLVPITAMPGWYEFDEAAKRLIGDRTSYSLGQRVTVRVTGCDVLSRRIEFELA